jgi:hypothetical protein
MVIFTRNMAARMVAAQELDREVAPGKALGTDPVEGLEWARESLRGATRVRIMEEVTMKG